MNPLMVLILLCSPHSRTVEVYVPYSFARVDCNLALTDEHNGVPEDNGVCGCLNRRMQSPVLVACRRRVFSPQPTQHGKLHTKQTVDKRH